MERQNPVVLAYGGGTNSTAIICGWIEKGLQPFDLILFADTGGEKPHTYKHIEVLNRFLEKNGFPQITVVRKVRRDGSVYTLEQNCLDKKMLPSIAYGYKGCSHKYKIQPQDKYCNNHKPFKAHWKAGGLVDKLIGYDFAESRRWMKAKVEDEKYRYVFPLVEWEWNRDDCVAAIKRMGLEQPGKSACFFCPSSKKPELESLRQEYPLLFQRAIAMEDNAKDNLTSIKGLGRNFSWRDYMEGKMSQTELFEAGRSQCDWCVDFEDA
jgi:hypothetical protein